MFISRKCFACGAILSLYKHRSIVYIGTYLSLTPPKAAIFFIWGHCENPPCSAPFWYRGGVLKKINTTDVGVGSGVNHGPQTLFPNNSGSVEFRMHIFEISRQCQYCTGTVQVMWAFLAWMRLPDTVPLHDTSLSLPLTHQSLKNRKHSFGFDKLGAAGGPC